MGERSQLKSTDPGKNDTVGLLWFKRLLLEFVFLLQRPLSTSPTDPSSFSFFF